MVEQERPSGVEVDAGPTDPAGHGGREVMGANRLRRSREQRCAATNHALSRWFLSAAAVRGDDDYKAGKPCQDAVACCDESPLIVGALADGAGSASLSHFGAVLVVEETCAFFRAHFDSLIRAGDAAI